MNSSIVDLLSKLISQSRKAKAIKYILDGAKHSNIDRKISFSYASSCA